jgi:hypothetical protein
MTTMTAPATAPAVPLSVRIYSWRERDQYGRACTRVRVGGVTAAMVVKLPRSWTDEHPEEQYLVNDWTLPTFTENKVSYWPTRAEALAFAMSIARQSGGVDQ